ncbi:MAG: hypothetical protein OEW08_11605, partial [Gammaproteobacteria bacterium]|nr:hypothetical protein [Gammaproteobacteria bacterium]
GFLREGSSNSQDSSSNQQLDAQFQRAMDEEAALNQLGQNGGYFATGLDDQGSLNFREMPADPETMDAAGNMMAISDGLGRSAGKEMLKNPGKYIPDSDAAAMQKELRKMLGWKYTPDEEKLLEAERNQKNLGQTHVFQKEFEYNKDHIMLGVAAGLGPIGLLAAMFTPPALLGVVGTTMELGTLSLNEGEPLGPLGGGVRAAERGLVANSVGPSLGVLEDAAFAQVPAKLSKAFSEEGQKIYSQAAGREIKTVGDLTDALKQGLVKPEQVPINYVVIDGEKIIANTRSSSALTNAEIPKRHWYGVDKTGVKAYGDVTFDDLVRNQLNRNYGGSVQNARRY